MLKPEGYIAGSVPNRDSWMWRMSGRKISKGDFPPNHFLRFSKEALSNFYKRMGFTDIFIEPTPVKISELVPYFQVLITGGQINKFLRKIITTHELAGEGTSIYKELPTWRKVIFKSLKGLRFLIFFFPALIFKYISERLNLYFQCRS